VPSFANGAHSHDMMSYGDCGAAPSYTGELATYCYPWLSLLNYGRIGQRLVCADPRGSLDLGLHQDELCWQTKGEFATLIDPANQTVDNDQPAPGPDPLGPSDETAPQISALGAPQPLPQATEFIRVAGRLLADRSVEFWPAYVGSAGGAPSVSTPHAAFEIRLLDANGTLVGRHGIDPQPSSAHGGRRRSLSFDARLPWHPATHKIVLARDDFVFGERVVSANPPSVRVLSPNGGESWPPRVH